MTAPLEIMPEYREILLALFSRFISGVTVLAYGSRVKGTARTYSDLDLVVFATPAQRFLITELKEALDESNLPFLVDVLIWDELPESFHRNIAAGYVVMQAGKTDLAEVFRGIIEGNKVVVQKGQQMQGVDSDFPIFPTFPLDDCLDALIDYRGKTPEKTDKGIPLITAKIIKGGRIEKANEFIAKNNYDAWMKRGIPKAGDVVLTVEAPLGEVAQLGPEKIALAQRVVTLRGKAGFLDSTYLLYLFQTEEIQEQLKARATGTTVIGIKQSELRKINVSIPPFSLQRSAASILKALDDRITLLRETNATLEAIAQALFKSWFVNFDPVHANFPLDGRVVENEEQIRTLSNIRDTLLPRLISGQLRLPEAEVILNKSSLAP